LIFYIFLGKKLKSWANLLNNNNNK
jgi:hypothetical protein